MDDWASISIEVKKLLERKDLWGAMKSNGISITMPGFLYSWHQPNWADVGPWHCKAQWQAPAAAVTSLSSQRSHVGEFLSVLFEKAMHMPSIDYQIS